MANLIGVLSHCERGDEVILGHLAHTFLYEAGGISAFGGIHSRQLINQSDGTLLLPDIMAAIRYQNDHFPPTKLICLENTHNLCNGSPLEKDYISNVVEIAKSNSLKVHVDGARIFNASAALGVSPSDLNEGIDSVSFLSFKGFICAYRFINMWLKKFYKKSKKN